MTKKRSTKKIAYRKYEIKKLVLKSMLNNYYYKTNYKLYYTKLFNTFPINSSTSRYRTYCMLQLQGKSISDLSNYLDIWWNIVQTMVF